MNKIRFSELDLYTQDPDTYLEEITELYSKNEVIEAFVLLHGLAEYKMNMIWPLTIVKDGGSYVKVKYWGFNDILNLLREHDLINKNLFSNLKSLQKGRNQVVHYFGNKYMHKSNVKSKTLSDQFTKGKRALQELNKIHLKLFTEFIEETK